MTQRAVLRSLQCSSVTVLTESQSMCLLTKTGSVILGWRSTQKKNKKKTYENLLQSCLVLPM